MEEEGIGSVFFIGILWLALFLWSRDRNSSSGPYDDEEDEDGF